MAASTSGVSPSSSGASTSAPALSSVAHTSRWPISAAIERAEAEKVLAVKAGEADAESKYLSGVGVSRMRAAITDGFNDSIKKMGQDNGLSPQEVVNMMLVTQYLDCLKDFAVSGKSSVIVPHGLGATAEMQSAVRNGMLQIPKMEG